MTSLNTILQLINTNIDLYLPNENKYNEILLKAIKYSLDSNGKRIRPMLMISVFEMLGGRIDEIMPFAIALEYIHTYSLIHDDLPSMDNDDYRRGKLSNHKVFGDNIALLCGDSLLNQSFVITSKYSSNINHIKASLKLSECAFDMIQGQVSDLKILNPSYEDLEYIYTNKTAKLFIASCIVPALYLNISEVKLKKLSSLGLNIGLAFQFADDILDYKNDDGLNSVKLFGVDFVINRFITCINNAKSILAEFDNNDNLLNIIESINNSVQNA